ncbi:nuclear transport factor 2 family protein [Niveispirillum sp.]|uniref:nuclear transport factor 2 family protein n=1 Tax=Niveispirillum sp. TaxID=1917217 RepID=UPI001B532455|nr:nuclear transport factor 2 family protein [Niveispirillum sp.]MBP7339620.1 nuclear transport factor 2 family protein [Niveispirillum sp.]
MNLPSPIQAYFDADKHGNEAAMAQAFAPDAVVKDEGHAYAGTQAIIAWWHETKEKYRTVLEPLEMNEEDGAITVRAMATGQFPGSPAMLAFLFRLESGRISHLEIGA